MFLLHGFPECWLQIKFLVDKGLQGDRSGNARLRWLQRLQDIVAYDQQQGVIIGHDWGCIIACHTAWLHPDRIKHIGDGAFPGSGADRSIP